LRLELLQRIENEPDLLNSIITCDEAWIFTYDQETKQQSMHWKSTSSSRPPTPFPPQKTVVSLSMFKDMLIVFFDIQRIVLAGWVPSSLTVNQQYYIES